MDLAAIQTELQRIGIDGWLFFDHHHRDPLAYRVLGIDPPGLVSRRWYYLIPARGEPRKLVHEIEPRVLDALPGKKLSYTRWQEHEAGLKRMLADFECIAMQYSPNCAVPYVAHVDAGTVELVRQFGVKVVSSADLIQLFEATWTNAMLEMHLEAGRRIDRIREQTFIHIHESLKRGESISEWDVQQLVVRAFADHGLITSSPPIVAVNENASDSHYCPAPAGSSCIGRGDLVLLDLWAKLDMPDAVYYDVTWMAFCGGQIPEQIQRVFQAVVGARDAGITFIQETLASGNALRGFQVDDAVRRYLDSQGMAAFIRGRTGHSIGREVHGAGANMDNTETHDERLVIPQTCFSIEPGLYLPEFGVRSEVNVFIENQEPRVTGAIQTEIVPL